ncbi:hypothetical protein GCM10009759_64860 [Kitasatospora saccharophila]|uniref:Aminoacyl-transfer RNA synthetases class-II family profile domain-containing protein n=1 Tax=Kitasatospora saccharophila TaxID=407973 RepID=A0ABP5JN67_9ACTN
MADGFRTIQSASACLFAARARIETVPAYTGPRPYDAGHTAGAAVADLARRIEAEEVDGLLLQLTDPSLGSTIEALATTVRQAVTGLLAATGADPAAALAGAGTDGWWLQLAGVRWFLIVFAPCYPATSPRSTRGSSTTFLLLQPVHSFDRHATPKGTVIAPAVRERIRAAHQAAGTPYDAELAQQTAEAQKFVAPLHPDAPPVTWWLADTSSADTVRSGTAALAAAVARTHASGTPTRWDAPTELLSAAAVLFTAHPAEGADHLLAGIARLLDHGPHEAVPLHSAPGARGPRELDVLHHALAAAAEPGRPPWPHGPADPARLAAAAQALSATIPCRLSALRTAAVLHLLRLLPGTRGEQHRDLLRRTAWLLDPRTDDPVHLLLTLTGPNDPLAPPPRSSTTARPRGTAPLPLADWATWPTPGRQLLLAGRVTAVRAHRKSAFADLVWDGRTAQLALNPADAAGLRTGDLVAARGTCSTSRTGQPTLFVEHLDLHENGTPAPPPPSAVLTPVLDPLRAHLAASGFQETITPTLTSGYFGGAARPFTTWAHAAGQHQYLRVTSEIDLLATIAAGTTRCYEIGPSFRNEGQRGRPAVEFVMLEAYAADLTLPQATAYLADLVTNTTAFTAPLVHHTFDHAFAAITGIHPSDGAAVRALAAERIPFTAARTDDPDLLARRLWRHSVRQHLRGFTAITDIPGPASPLIAGTGRQARRVWLYADGLELAEIAANERAPHRLADAFTAQFAADRHLAHRSYQQVVDLYDSGLPPCVGFGMSVTRLAGLHPVHLPVQRRAPHRATERTP